MARRTINSGGSGSSAQHAEILRQKEAAQLLEEQAVAQAHALAAAQQAEEIINNDIAAANTANANADQQQPPPNMDPVARRSALLARINVQNISSEKNKRIAKGLQILQAKSLPFQVEEILQQPDMISLNLTEDEITELLEKLLTDTWRFCIDYRKSNDYTKSADWPIPSMQQ
jgi:hypothetical protein